MNGGEILRIVDAIHRDKNIDPEIVFEGIEQAILSAARKHFGEEAEISVSIERETGQPTAVVDGTELEPDEIGDLLGRIAAQTAKQVMIQKIREAERDALYEEYDAQRGQIMTGSVTRVDGGTVTVTLGKVEAILPRGEQIPGESHRVGERVRAVIRDVRKAGSRLRIILSRTHPELIRRLFELEIPEIAEHVIEVRSLAREAGYRSKVAVSCFDNKIDCVGACVGMRGARIRSIVDELAGERIDIVRWNDSLQVLVPNALQPAEVDDVILCPMLGKVIVLVRDDQLPLAIGKKGQNVRLASKLVGWDISVMTQDRLDERLESSVAAFSAVPDVSEELAENLVAQGFFTFDDLSVIEPDQLAELGGLTAEQCDAIVEFADVESLRIEKEEKETSRLERERRRLEAAEARAAEASAGESQSDSTEEDSTAADSTEADSTEAEATGEADAEETEASNSEDTGESEGGPSKNEESGSVVTEQGEDVTAEAASSATEEETEDVDDSGGESQPSETASAESEAEDESAGAGEEDMTAESELPISEPSAEQATVANDDKEASSTADDAVGTKLSAAETSAAEE